MAVSQLTPRPALPGNQGPANHLLVPVPTIPARILPRVRWAAVA
jgi:hypothetical protein